MHLYIVATPIGNLEDITLRALRILNEVDYILSEDTRVTKKLLDYYQIKTPLISYHHHSSEGKYKKILSLLREKSKIAMVSDAGVPGVSDPGGMLLEFLRSNDSGIEIEIIPGASALTSAIALSGIKMDKFLFLGFLPHKKGRQKMLREALESKYPVLLFESKHRVLKFLGELVELESSKDIIVLREMTKIYYTFYRGNSKSLLDEFKNNPGDVKGEFVIIIH